MSACFQGYFNVTGRVQLIQSHLLARISFELSGNLN